MSALQTPAATVFNTQQVHPDFQTASSGVEYYFLGNGRLRAIVQSVPAGSGATQGGIGLMSPDHFGRKSDSLLYDRRGLRATRILVTEGDRTWDPLSGSVTISWTYPDGIPTVRLEWRAGPLEVTEELFTAAEEPVLFRVVTLTNRGAAPVKPELIATLSANSGKMDEYEVDPARGMLTAIGYHHVRLFRADAKGVAFERRLTVNAGLLAPGATAQSVLALTLDWPREEFDRLGYARVREKTAADWKQRTSFHSGNPVLDHLFRVSSSAVRAAVADSGKMDGGIWQYNNEWARDSVMAGMGACMAGHFAMNRAILERHLQRVTSDGSTVEASRHRLPADMELDQNGELLTAVWTHWAWSGDDSLVRQYWKTHQAVADHVLKPVYRDAESGLVHNVRELWERGAVHGVRDGYEISYQAWNIVGLTKAVGMARLVGDAESARRWTEAAARMRQSMLHHPRLALVDQGRLIKRRLVDGTVQDRFVPPHPEKLGRSMPLGNEPVSYCDPDTSNVLPVFMGLVDPRGELAANTLRAVEKLWNQRWDIGGYGRYDVTSEPDSPGPWPFATLFVARAYAAAGNDEKVWRALRWLRGLQGGAGGAWFEYYGRHDTAGIGATGIIPWIWGEMLMLFVHHMLGVRPSPEAVEIRPWLIKGVDHLESSLGVGGHRLELNIERSGGASSAEVDGLGVRMEDGGIRLPRPVLSLLPCAFGMDRLWTWMAGQWPVEAPPLITDWNHDGKNEVLVLNRGGQLMVWSTDGAAIGKGQDGTATMLPEGRWTSTPFLTPERQGPRLLTASVEGVVAALDGDLRLLWQQKLSGETSWTMGRPAEFHAGGRRLYCFGDRKGMVTCFTAGGETAWKVELGAPIRLLPLARGSNLMVASGSALHCLGAAGKVLWKQDAGATIVSGPVAMGTTVVVGTEAGKLLAFSSDGGELWRTALGEAPDYTPTVMKGTLLCRGAFGNLYAIDAKGRRLWTRRLRSKSRAVVVVNGRIVLPTFDQHVMVLSADGELTDDYRVSGGVTGVAPVGDGSGDVVVMSATLLAYRLRPGLPKSQYGPAPAAENVTISAAPGRQAVVVSNPAGALLTVELTGKDSQGAPVRCGTITRRSLIELAAPGSAIEARISEASGKLLLRQAFQLGGLIESRLEATGLSARAESPKLPALYVGEADQGVFAVTSTLPDAVRARVSYEAPKTKDGKPFGGTIVLREVVETGTFNGEMAADALVPLGDAGLVSIPARQGVRLWASVDARGAQPGEYTGKLRIAALGGGTAPVELPLEVKVLPLRMPLTPALRLCTWDYVPNKWFGDPLPALDDMARHGVNIFPRTSSIPPGKVDAAGRLRIDWTMLDTELGRYQGRGIILFQLSSPPLEFAVPPSAEAKHRAELEYVRAFRDHVNDHGRSFDDYAFYPIDEPGLDYGKTTLPILLEAGKLIREADPRLRIYTDPVPSLSWKDFERIEPFIDIWCPNMRLVSGALSGDPRMERILKTKQVWSYECVSQVKSLSPLRYNRANAWRAKFFGLQGIGIWTHSTQEFDPWLTAKSFNDEYMLMYPGERPVPSVRWEAVRDGIEDIAAVELLEQAIG
ncbi:MAG: PQQ-binding-like beta-propeller repeat protein, partial [Acidobacteria bacterium]|nr:PQQ-binding-like beta-propeller repeat protein [Acidobacteriota bacterium]